MAEVITPPQTTPMEVIANVSRVVTKVVDRVAGDRSDYPLMVAAATVEALRTFDIEARIMYGPAAWIEVLEDNTPLWAGCWGKNFHFWAATRFGEVVDLNTSVAYRKKAHDTPDMNAIFSAPMIWSVEIPSFYRCRADGVAELELTDERDIKRYAQVLQEIREKCGPAFVVKDEPEFPNEAIVCPGRKILDDSNETFKKYDRILSVVGIPHPPVF